MQLRWSEEGLLKNLLSLLVKHMSLATIPCVVTKEILWQGMERQFLLVLVQVVGYQLAHAHA